MVGSEKTELESISELIDGTDQDVRVDELEVGVEDENELELEDELEVEVEVEVEDELSRENEAEPKDEAEDDGDKEEENHDDSAASNSIRLGDALGVSKEKLNLDKDGKLVGINVKVDGVEESIPMDTLIRGYQTDKHNSNESYSLTEKRKEFAKIEATVSADYNKRLKEVGLLSAYLAKSSLQAFEGVDWEKLRSNNPGLYASTQLDHQRKQEEFKKITDAIAQDMAWQEKKHSKTSFEENQTMVEEQAKLMLDNNPEWQDHDRLKKDFKELSDFTVSTYGISTQEFEDIQDSRVVELIKDAYKYHKGKREVAKAKKLNKKIPKFQRSGSKITRKGSKLTDTIKGINSVRGANRRNVQVNAVRHLLNGDY